MSRCAQQMSASNSAMFDNCIPQQQLNGCRPFPVKCVACKNNVCGLEVQYSTLHYLFV